MLLALLPAFAAEPAPTVSFPTENEHTLRLLGAHRVLKYTTTGALVLTAGLGVVSGINQPTLFGDGRCLTGDPVFGQPILGLVASNPAILGIPRDDREDFSRVMRTVHVGVVIGGTYVTTLAIEEGQGTTR